MTVATPDVDSWEDKREDVIKQAIDDYVVNQVDDGLIDAITAHNDDVALPDGDDRPDVVTDKDVHRRLIKRLAEHPPLSWSDLNTDVVEKQTESVKNAQQEYETRAECAVQDMLGETPFVSVDPDALE